MSQVVLAVVAHPDDEVLGCGGTLARHAQAGDMVHVLYLADGLSSRGVVSAAERQQRRMAAIEAARALGLSGQEWLDFPDNRMDGLDLLDVIMAIEQIFRKLAPTIVYTHHVGDLNVDHRIANQAVLTACRPQPGATVKEVYAFETVSSTEWNPGSGAPFVPTCFVDIGLTIGAKMNALKAYEHEMRLTPHARSPESVLALAKYRGCGVGLGNAEAFMVLRFIRSC